jgi:hypothetical protein
MVASVGFMLLGLMQFALAGMRPPVADRHEQRGNTLSALVPVGLGLVTFLLGVRQYSRRS